MPGYLSAQALADLALPGLPTTRRGLDMLASRKNWRFVARVGRGGGRLFATADLPDVARAVLLARRIDAAQERCGMTAKSSQSACRTLRDRGFTLPDLATPLSPWRDWVRATRRLWLSWLDMASRMS